MIDLLLKHKNIFVFCFIGYFFSSLGQTFFLSLFNEHIFTSYGYSRKSLSTVYSAATLCASFIIPYIGIKIDQLRAYKLSIIFTFCLAIGLFGLINAHFVFVLFLSYLIIRLFGQSSMTLLVTTITAKLFGKHRGKATMLCSFGRSLGEGVLPSLLIILIGAFGWKGSIGVLATSMVLILLPVSLLTIRDVCINEPLYEDLKSEKHAQTKQLTKKHPYFWIFCTTATLIPFIMTGVFFHSDSIKQYFQWSSAAWASGFVYYSVGLVLFNIKTGILVDRFSAKRMVNFTYIPFVLAILLLKFHTFIDSKLLLPVFFFLVGASIGLSGIIKNSFLAEVFELQKLGAHKGILSLFMVISTSLSPILFAFFIDHLSWRFILNFTLVYSLICIVFNLKIYFGLKKLNFF